jgi:hypothetical protein
MLMAPGNEVLSVLTLSYWDQGQGQKVAVVAMLMLLLLVGLMLVELGFRRLETYWAARRERAVQRAAVPAVISARSVPDVR